MPVSINGNTGVVTGLAALPDSAMSSGSIIQVKQAVKTDTATSTSATFTDISGLSVSITPASTSNKILVECCVCSGGQADSFQAFKVLRDSTAIGLGTGGTGNQTNVSFGLASPNAATHQYALRYGVFKFLDSPSSTSALTYKIQWSSIYSSYSSWINRPNNSADSAFYMFGSSSITVSEVAA
tara:strand:+ start:64 stop:612 length:549 start_codon:yes stop_codon:yes gene_type:complete